MSTSNQLTWFVQHKETLRVYLVGMILEMMEKWEWKIGEKMDEMSVWLEGEWGRKMVGPAIFSPAPPNWGEKVEGVFWTKLSFSTNWQPFCLFFYYYLMGT